jgi:hypothetical protein
MRRPLFGVSGYRKRGLRWISGPDFFLEAKSWFLLGVRRKTVFLAWFFAGENVVNCVVNVVN